MSKSKVNEQAKLKLSDSQRQLLSTAAQRDDRCLTRPAGLRGVKSVKLSETLIAAGFAREVMAKAAAPVWRQDGEGGVPIALKLTAAGKKAIVVQGELHAIEGQAMGGHVPGLMRQAGSVGIAVGNQMAATFSSSLAPAQCEPRPTSKIAAVIGLLLREEGATLAELIAATDWLPHTTRAALTGLRKRGYGVTRDRSDRQRGSVYQIAAPPPRDALEPTKIAAEVA